MVLKSIIKFLYYLIECFHCYVPFKEIESKRDFRNKKITEISNKKIISRFKSNI